MLVQNLKPGSMDKLGFSRERLLKDSFVVLEQMRALDRSRFGDARLAELMADEMRDIDRQMMTMFGVIIPSH